MADFDGMLSSEKVKPGVEIPVTLLVSSSLMINDVAVLDLSRGEAIRGAPFEDQEELLRHLARNLVVRNYRLSQLDGWADLPDDAVTVGVDDIESNVEWDLVR